MINYIGICGPMTSGKTTFAEMLRDAFVARSTQVAIAPFAKPLKSFAYALGWNGKKDNSGRRLLQILGTEVGRDCIHPDIWVHHWEDYISQYSPTTVIIADDVRFENEVEFIKEHGGIIYQMCNRGCYNPSHASEVGIGANLIDLDINNGDTLQELRQKAILIVKEMV